MMIDKELMTVAAGASLAGFAIGWLAAKLACRCRNGKGGAQRQRLPGRQDAKPAPRRHAPPADGSIEIYVGNISYELTEDQLRKEFEAFGKVNSARIITNSFNGRSKGYGFVHMPNQAEVEAAIKSLNDKEILGRRLRCNVAKNFS